MGDRHLAHYLQVLGLQPGAKADDIAIAYFAIKRELTGEGTAEAEVLAEQVDHAFAILKTRYRTRPREKLQRQVNRFLVTAVMALAVLSGLSWFQLSNKLRPYLVSFDVGDRLCRIDDHEPFGTVLHFDINHEFPDGSRRAAYGVRLDSSQREIWISSWAATKGLQAR